MGGGRKKSGDENPGKHDEAGRASARQTRNVADIPSRTVASTRVAIIAKSNVGGAGELNRCGGALVGSTGLALSKLIWAVALPAGLNQAIFASTANSAARTHSSIPNAVSRECRIKKPPCIFSSLPLAEFPTKGRGATPLRVPAFSIPCRRLVASDRGSICCASAFVNSSPGPANCIPVSVKWSIWGPAQRPKQIPHRV